LVAVLQKLSFIAFLQWARSFSPITSYQTSDVARTTNATEYVQQLDSYSDEPTKTLQFTIPYMYHVMYLATAAAFNISRVPERWWPGKFDVYGHSHQWFHVFIFLGIREQFWIIMEEISRDRNPVSAPPMISSVFNTWCAIVLLLSLLGAILIWFNQSLTPYLEAQDQKDSCLSKAQINKNSVPNRTKCS
jgi:hypothetical protein